MRRLLAGAAALGAGYSQAQTGDRRAMSVSAGRVIDFHTHMIDPSLTPSGGSSMLRGRESWAARLASPAEQVAEMKQRGIDCHVVAQANVVQGISWGDARRDLEVHRRVNDRLAEEWVAAYPDRFMAAFGLPTQDLRLALPELERAVTKLGLKVLQISSCTPDGVYYGDPRLHPLWEAVQHFGVTVLIHPHGQSNSPPLDQFALWNSVGQGIEEAKAMSSIIYQGVFDKFPALKIVVSHGGGFLPHYYGRMDRNVANVPGSVKNISKPPSAYLKSFYYDSCVYAPEVLAALVKVVGADRIVLGGDYPMGASDPVGLLRATPGLSSSDVARISQMTPAKLLV